MKKIMTICFCIWISFVLGCGDQEKKANKIYNKASAMQRAGGFDVAEPFYKEIVEKYPSTKVAVKVKEILASNTK